jgi:DNA invertase Pin-like site-specific DNA recombinase
MSTFMAARSHKISAEHLQRNAYVYVRQSSSWQVENNLESQRRQYRFADWATELGWSATQVVVLDEDQAKSGALAGTRSGCGKLVTAVAGEQVGIVLSLELSRLARNSPDWHQLLYLCRWTNTLLGDEHGIYNPADTNDRLLLGMRGQFNEIELETSIHRMVEARWCKAERGEYLTIPVAGYDIDDLGQMVMTSDTSVANAIHTVFEKFDELGSGRQVFVWWRDNQMKFPVRRMYPRGHPVVWAAPRYKMILDVLNHPVYAGVYVFGRSKTVCEIDPQDPRQIAVKKRRAREEHPRVLIRDHHQAYISYEKYLQNRERIRGNVQMKPSDGEARSGPAREGAALLQGLVRCGRCGRRMHVSYGGGRPSPKVKRILQYRCGRMRTDQAGQDCQLVGRRQIEKLVVDAFLEVIGPAGVEAALRAQEQIERERESVARHWGLQVEKAEYEAERAARQYDAAEPENRVVVRELERRWNQRLEELEAVRAQAEAARHKQRPLSEQELRRTRQLAHDLGAVWEAESTTDRDRKRLLRCIIEEVQVRGEEKSYEVRIVWKGGAMTELSCMRHRRGDHQWNRTPEETVELVTKLIEEFDDAQIARILNKQGRRTGAGVPFTKAGVIRLRFNHGIAAPQRQQASDPREGPFTADQAAAELGVAMCTIHRWLREGVLPGRQTTPGAPWRIVLTDELRRRLTGGDAPAGWVGLNEAARRLGLSQSQVAHLVNRAELPAVRTTVGKRTCWKIDVSQATCGRQDDLFDQMRNGKTKEA